MMIGVLGFGDAERGVVVVEGECSGCASRVSVGSSSVHTSHETS